MPSYVIATTNSSVTASTSDWAIDQNIWATWSTGTSCLTTASTVMVRISGFTASSTDSRQIYHRTEEQVAADREARIRAEGERALAREKAEVLLRECLSPRQMEELALHGHFHLETIARSGERRRYRIERGRSRNVRQVTPEGRIIKTLCMHPVMGVPDADTMLAQKLYLEGAEDEFLRIANHS